MGLESFLSNELLIREVPKFESHCPRERAFWEIAYPASRNSPGGNAMRDIIITTPQPFFFWVSSELQQLILKIFKDGSSLRWRLRKKHRLEQSTIPYE